MNRFLLFMVVCLGALVCSQTAWTQSKVSAKARLSTGLVRLGDVAHIRLTVENDENARLLALPEIDGVRVGRPSPPKVAPYNIFEGGRIVRRISIQWTIPLEPLEEGEFSIPPLRVEVGGKEQEVPVTPASLKIVKDKEAAKLGLFDMPGRPTRVFEGQPFALHLRVGWVNSLQVRKVSLLLPWWGTQPGVLNVEGPGFSTRGQNVVRLSVNGRSEVPFEATGVETIDGNEFQIFSHRVTMVATRAGKLEYPTGTFVFAEELEQSGSPFRRSRMREYYATLDDFEIEVLPIPEEGRPFEWGGAVGTLVADRRVSKRDVTAGETLQLEVTWSGMANVEFFDVPDLKRLEAFSGFRVLGVEDPHLGMERRAVYELVPLSSEVTEIPAVPLWIFNPETESYEELKTEPIPIRVTPADDLDLNAAFGEEAASKHKLDLADLRKDLPPVGIQRGPGAAWIFAGLLGTLLGWILLRSAVRRNGDPASQRVRKRRAAMRDLQKELDRAQTPIDASSAVHRYLGVRSDEPAQAWVGRDLTQWASEKDWPEGPRAKAQALQSIMEGLDEAAYAQPENKPDASTVLSAVRELAKEGVL